MHDGCPFDPEEAKGLKRVIIEHDRVMVGLFGDGNGNKGLLPQFTKLITQMDQKSKDDKDHADRLSFDMAVKERRESHRNSLINFGIFIVAILSLLGLALQVHMAIQDHRLNLPKISDSPASVNATMQTGQSPTMYNTYNGR